jgi:predicted DNA-binding transcriptional regulator AlpA
MRVADGPVSFVQIVAELDLVGVPEIAELLGVNRRTAWRYVQRADFPSPVVAIRGKRMWRRTAVLNWAKRTLPLPTDPRSRRSSEDG